MDIINFIKKILEKIYYGLGLQNFKNLRVLVLCAILIGCQIVISFISIPIMGDQLRISFTFIFKSLGSFLFGPAIAFMSGIIENTLSFVLKPGGFGFDIRYGINAGIAGIIYAMFLYRANYKSEYFIIRIAAAKISVNLICNIIIGTYLLRGYFGSAANVITIARIFKNVILLPAEVMVMFFVMRYVAKAAEQYSFIGKNILPKAGIKEDKL